MEQPAWMQENYREGWTYDIDHKCIYYFEQISSKDANECEVYSFGTLDIFVVEFFYFPESANETWPYLPKRKYFIKSYTKAIKFAKDLLKKNKLGVTYVFGIRPISQDEFEVFENVYAHLIVENNLNSKGMLTIDEALSLPDPEYIVKIE
jgi:hypothetical protein